MPGGGFAASRSSFRSELAVVIYYRFHQTSGPLIVITNDVSGANLPKADNPWRADGQTQIEPLGRPRFGIEPDEIIATIELDGLFVTTLGAR